MSSQILCGIYRIRNALNGRIYVGASVNLTVRWRLHRRHLNKGTHHCRPLQHAWVKYGETAFVFEIIEAVGLNKYALNSREQVYLDEAFVTRLAYNVCRIAGSVLGVKHTEEARANMAAAQKGRKPSAKAIENARLARMGMKHTPEAKAKMRLAAIGKPIVKHTAEAKEKIRLANIGRKHSAETKAGMSLSRRGRKHSAEALNKMRGRKLSAEAVDKMRGRKHSAATRAKLSRDWRLYHHAR